MVESIDYKSRAWSADMPVRVFAELMLAGPDIPLVFYNLNSKPARKAM